MGFDRSFYVEEQKFTFAMNLNVPNGKPFIKDLFTYTPILSFKNYGSMDTWGNQASIVAYMTYETWIPGARGAAAPPPE